MERDNVCLGLEYLLYVKIFQQQHTCSLTNGVKIFHWSNYSLLKIFHWSNYSLLKIFHWSNYSLLIFHWSNYSLSKIFHWSNYSLLKIFHWSNYSLLKIFHWSNYSLLKIFHWLIFISGYHRRKFLPTNFCQTMIFVWQRIWAWTMVPCSWPSTISFLHFKTNSYLLYAYYRYNHTPSTVNWLAQHLLHSELIRWLSVTRPYCSRHLWSERNMVWLRETRSEALPLLHLFNR